jgi:hypothetical protein
MKTGAKVTEMKLWDVYFGVVLVTDTSNEPKSTAYFFNCVHKAGELGEETEL